MWKNVVLPRLIQLLLCHRIVHAVSWDFQAIIEFLLDICLGVKQIYHRIFNEDVAVISLLCQVSSMLPIALSLAVMYLLLNLISVHLALPVVLLSMDGEWD